MNYRERMREYLKEPELDGSVIGYGKWCALTSEQRELITRLLDEMDSADEYIKKLYFENQKIIEKNQKLIEENFILKKEINLHSNKRIITSLEIRDI